MAMLAGSPGSSHTVRTPLSEGRLAYYLAHGKSSVSIQDISIIIMELTYCIYAEKALVEMLSIHTLLFFKKEHLKFGNEAKR